MLIAILMLLHVARTWFMLFYLIGLAFRIRFLKYRHTGTVHFAPLLDFLAIPSLAIALALQESSDSRFPPYLIIPIYILLIAIPWGLIYLVFYFCGDSGSGA
jgi:hypothetical protein